MQETLLIKFLKTLNHIEIRQFRDFVNSPAFNKNRELTGLFWKFIINSIRSLPQMNFPSKICSGKFFKMKKFKYAKIKNLISDLFGLGKDFLAFSAYHKDQYYKEKKLLMELRNRNLDVAFEKTYKYADKQT